MRGMARAAIVLALVLGLWLAYGNDDARRKVLDVATDFAHLLSASKGPKANWGDVAKKVSEFASEERSFKDGAGRAENAGAPADGQ